ncbi:glycosyltransferase family 4 protein [Knoellia sp. LjRoot47]|uniref:glycosyltransferase family 4 protein n=1 Tax=Knoellia sp. LjRoot47 TaxID=3342330 RepID=UPI003ED1025C
MSGLRILIHGLNYAPEPTGIARYTAGMASGLAERGHNVRVVTGYPHYPAWSLEPGYTGLSSDEVVDGVPVRRLRHLVRGGSAGARIALEASFAAHSLARPMPPADVVLAVTPSLLGVSAALTSVRLTRRRRPALGIIVQDIYSRAVTETAVADGRLTRPVVRLEGGLLRAADGVSVIHDRFARTINRDLDVPLDRIRVIRNWSEPPSQEADPQWTRERLGWAEDEVIVLHAGNMGTKQGLENVIDAAGLVGPGGPRVRFVLLGDGNQRTLLERWAQGNHAVDLVRPLPDGAFAAALAHADILLVNERPGVSEMSVPSKLTTYFWAGRPVVAAVDPDGATAHEISSSGAGVVVAPGSPAELLRAVQQLAGDPARAQVMGAAGRRYAADVLSRQAAVDGYETWVRSLVDVRDARR